MSFDVDIKAAHPFYKDMNNFAYCWVYAFHGILTVFNI